MKTDIKELSSNDEGRKHINYFNTNADRMHYHQGRAESLLIGSSKVEVVAYTWLESDLKAVE